MIEGVMGGALVAVALMAVWFDVRENRIPNVITVVALGVALVLRGFGGPTEVGIGVLGAAICFLAALPIFWPEDWVGETSS